MKITVPCDDLTWTFNLQFLPRQGDSLMLSAEHKESGIVLTLACHVVRVVVYPNAATDQKAAQVVCSAPHGADRFSDDYEPLN